ncbi:serine/threonine protein kinase [Bacillus sp. J14TS2]|uniref:ATP-binding sensor histidine kinase n=1 Tax=Bacillus sp. J14TS2 TaxID=2807188 RepID=UPI001B22128E|nr:ATP-binding sensor histidine kinase [Bacillus sp. J14TS2]GIN72072.1 serine/threonine protein kinase [Bacillus sp. J14TS2]
MNQNDPFYLPGYDMIETMEINESWHFVKAIEHHSKKAFLIKKMVGKQIYPEGFQMAVHEYHIKTSHPLKGILKPISLQRHGRQPLLITEFFPFSSLEKLLQRTDMNMDRFFKIAIKLVTVINELHNGQIIHKAIHPGNILIGSKQGDVKLTGFQHAVAIKRESYRAHINPSLLGKEIAYISPEQTGRINRFLDHRSDLYSLGVVFYEMLTGRVPFVGQDSLELIYAHIAKNPIPPNEVNAEIPEFLSEMVMKLLEKLPESRYQSAYGLREDLLELSRLYSKTMDSKNYFTLAQKDSPQQFDLGERLFGREAEKRALMDSFQDCCQGKSAFVLIAGISGVGKTALVNEVREPLVRNKGYFISGKFDLLNRQTPYAPLIAAFKDLMKQVLSEGEAKTVIWKECLLGELRSHLPIIASLLPEIQWLVGQQPKPDSRSAIEVHNQILFAFYQLIRVFATKEHPLVLFMDDLQWADQATLDLLHYILLHNKEQCLLVMGAYRPNEVDSMHPFKVTTDELAAKEVQIRTIELEPLEMAAMCEWIQYLFLCTDEQAHQLAMFIQRITKGNPFFAQQLFQSFYDHQLLVFAEDKMRWIIDFDQLTKLPIQDDMANYIMERFYRLPLETQEILAVASCIGNQFALHILSAIFHEEKSNIARQLMRAINEGLILPLDPRYKWTYSTQVKDGEEKLPLLYKFLHDKVQQAVYSTMTLADREKSHMTIGRLLVSYYQQENTFEEHIFDIVNHLNACHHHLEKEEIVRLAEWNTLAGEKAKKGAAFKAAHSFYQQAYELLNRAEGKPADSIFSNVILGLGELAYANNQFEEAESRFNQAIDLVQTREEKLKIYNLKITLYTHQHRVEEAVASGLTALKLFGWHLNDKPGKLAVAKEYIQSKLMLRNRKAEELKQLPKMTNEEHRLIVQTFINMNAPAFHINQNLATLLMLKAFNFILRHGTTDLAMLVYNNYALILSAGFQNFQASYEFGRLALHHAKESGNAHLLGRVYFVFASFINHWKHPLINSEQSLVKSQQYCIESGNFHLAGANSSFICMSNFLKGHDLLETAETIEQQLQFSNQIQYDLSKGYLNEMNDWIAYLNGHTHRPDWYQNQFIEDESAEVVHYTMRLQMSYLLDDQPAAERLMDKLNKLVDRSLTLVIAPEYYFYEALWLARMYPTSNRRKRLQIKRRIKTIIGLFHRWKTYAPENYEHKYLLIKARELQLKGKVSQAGHYFEQAVNLAQKNGFNQDEAIACECAENHYWECSYQRFSKLYLSAAIKAFEKWGAPRKAGKLRETYYERFSEHHEELFDVNQSTTSYLDMTTILQAARTLSGEMVMEKLLAKLIKIVFINSGAQQGLLFLKRDDHLQLVAKGKADGEVVIVDGNLQEDYPRAIFNYVEKSLEPIVLYDARKEERFGQDPYMKAHTPISVLCFPILHLGNLTGILYLENNTLAGAFSKDRIEILNVLASQAAVSLENAALYGSLEKKVRERTALLETAHNHLEKANDKLEKAGQIRRRFLSDISHDLRSPITSIQGYIEGILDRTIDPLDHEEVLKRSHHHIVTLNQMIQDLFELAKMESGEISFEMEYIPVDQLFAYLKKQMEGEIREAGLQFEAKIQDPLQEEYPLVEVNERKLEQVLQNLVANAVVFTKAGKISFELVYDRDLRRISFMLRDTGRGIPEDELPYIFDRFYTRSANGNGLGLAICKEIIRYHKGEMEVASEVNVGTCFTFHLPVYVLQEHELLDFA